MTARLIVIITLLANSAFAQIRPRPTRFDKFIHKPKIEWAAYASDTFRFGTFDDLLLTRLQKKQIKASLPFESRTQEANDIRYIPIDSIDKYFFGEEAASIKIDTALFKITEVTQVLYIEDGKLKSYIPWVTPTVPTYLSTGKYIGERFYFNTAYNYKYNFKPRKRAKLLMLGQTKKMLKLDDPANKLKEMYGRNLLQTVWPYIVQNETVVYDMQGNPVDAAVVDINKKNQQPQTVIPIFDSTGAIQKWSVTSNELYRGQYTDVQLVQDWYYDQKKNIVFSYIREIYLYLKEADKDIVPVFKLVFK